jgi:vacuolar-type H+-ATPase subunit C/Vma6
MVKEQVSDFADISGDPEMTLARQGLFREQIAPVIGLVEAYERYAPLFLAFLRQYEAQNAKILLAKAFGKQSQAHWYDIGPFAILDRDLLRKKLSLDEVKSLLRGVYLPDDFKDSSTYRQMDIQVDISSALNFWRASTLVSPQAKKEFQYIMLKRIAVLMVIWSWRLRWNYHWSDENIRVYMQDLHELFGGHAWSHVGIEEKALNLHLEQLHKGSGKEPSMVDIERQLEQKYYAWVSSMFHRDFHSLYCVVAYLWLLFYQIKNLFCIIDGKRFGLSPDEILNKITLAA